MEQLVAAWPVDVDEIALVGHSMGGLVARSACCHAAEADADWARLVKHSVSLGTPHMGAPLEQAVHVLSAGLARLPETRPFANFLRRRSGGIRDLRQGRSWTRTGATATRTRCAGRLRRDSAARGRDALLRVGDDHPQRPPPASAG